MQLTTFYFVFQKHNQIEINLFNEHMSKIQSLRKAQFKNDENFVEDVSSKLLENEDYQKDLFRQKRKQLLQVGSFYLLKYAIKNRYIILFIYFRMRYPVVTLRLKKKRKRMN